MLIWFSCSRSYLIDVVEAGLEDNSSSMASFKEAKLKYLHDRSKKGTHNRGPVKDMRRDAAYFPMGQLNVVQTASMRRRKGWKQKSGSIG
jgi:hypothetical protein